MKDHECDFFLMNDIAAHVCECGNVIIGYNGTVGIEYVEKTKYDEHLNKALGRANALEEWLTEFRDQLKKENVFHKNTGIINAINELLDEATTDI